MYFDEQSESLARNLNRNQTNIVETNTNNNDNLNHYSEVGISDSLLGNEGKFLFRNFFLFKEIFCWKKIIYKFFLLNKSKTSCEFK